MAMLQLQKFSESRVFKFLMGGGVAAAFNVLLIYLLIDKLGFHTPLLRNLANIVSIELSLLLSFFIYRIWVWPGGVWTFEEVLYRQIPLYHVSAGTAVLVRVLLLFPVLDWLKVDPRINTLIGVLLSACLNYVISDRMVFNKAKKNEPGVTESELHYPEGLAPALQTVTIPKTQGSEPEKIPSENSNPIKLFSIVIPAYNEEGGIAETVLAVSLLLDEKNINYEIFVVNDNSRDRTQEVLEQLVAQNPKVRYINNYYPNGFGFAVRCGLENFSGDAVAVVMADSSDSPENIVDYYNKLQEGYECVFGSRFIRGGRVIDYPPHKLFINRMANLFIQILFGLKFNDTTNAFKAYRKEVIDGIFPLLSHHFNLTVEMPLKSIVRGYTYTTVPITWRNRKTGVSKLKIKEMGSRYLFIVLSLFLEKQLSRGDYYRKNSRTITR
jgi:dolichol-phosphate mannosyltransferase